MVRLKLKKQQIKALSKDETYLKWLSVRTIRPEITIKEFCKQNELDEAEVSAVLRERNLTEDDRVVLSKYIATTIVDVANKLNIDPHEVRWVQYKSIAEFNGGTNRYGVERYHITICGGFNRIRDAHFEIKPTPVIVEASLLNEQAKSNRLDGKRAVQRQLFKETAEEWASRVYGGRVQPIKRKVTKNITKQSKKIRYVQALLSDLHYGGAILKTNTGVADYLPLQETRRTAKLLDQILTYKPQYRAQNVLKLLINGDIIEGTIHGNNSATLSVQWTTALHYLIQVVVACAREYLIVEIEMQTGNHGRMPMKHPGRATYDKWDSYETMLYIALGQACRNLKNVKFNYVNTPYTIYNCHGNFFLTHGDTVINTGNPGNNVNVRGFETQTNSINSGLMQLAPDLPISLSELSAVVCGHTHEAIAKPLKNGVFMLVNGCLTPPNDYAASLGILNNKCYQLIWESVEGYPVGDVRFITFDSRTDNDKSLDGIITPLKGV